MPDKRTQLTFADDSDEYKQFEDKFKPKKTTDDCYTPPEIYELVADYACKRYGLDHANIVRPFWPGGDYEREDYPDGCVVVDNPPFSLLSKIISFYMERGIGFFLFAPTMTCLSARKWATKINHIVCHSTITYENGARVPTSFVTNLDTDGTVAESNLELTDAINAKDDELQKANKATVPKYEYPDNVITAAKLNWYAAHHTPFRINARDCCFISHLDAMGSKGIFGGAYLLSERAAAERAAAERAAAERAAAIKWQLSPRELEMVRLLGGVE